MAVLALERRNCISGLVVWFWWGFCFWFCSFVLGGLFDCLFVLIPIEDKENFNIFHMIAFCKMLRWLFLLLYI